MLDWLREYRDVLTLLISGCTLLVWVFYAQLLLSGFKRQRRPRLIINRGAGKGVGALCLLSNMSAEPIFINQLIVHLHTSRGTLKADVTDVRQSSEDDFDQEVELYKATRQGPLKTGDFTHIGTFQRLIARVAAAHDLELAGLKPPEGWTFTGLEIYVIAFYGSDKQPIGVRRRFRLGQYEDHYCSLIAESRQTEQFTSIRQRRQVQRIWMAEFPGD
ncbi:hypothetical protein IQ22_01025 [Pseudomonas duriflava]|uniref:Uncharacterized protein n=1 Tax=Pseudomonas duriflava TaxID=459528 RepID=A0A562QIK3_9PSED|nr:hypothetical protein [Pseudomonas duriflava]TWI56574.1 hypothetical protein IQ22_01025 [Pseudomonas duriflava]